MSVINSNLKSNLFAGVLISLVYLLLPVAVSYLLITCVGSVTEILVEVETKAEVATDEAVT